MYRKTTRTLRDKNESFCMYIENARVNVVLNEVKLGSVDAKQCSL